MYTLPYDQRSQDPVRNLSQLRRTASQGAPQCDLFPTVRYGNSAAGVGRASQSESFRGGRLGHQGTFKKATLRPCAVRTASYDLGMSNAANKTYGAFNLVVSFDGHYKFLRITAVDVDAALADVVAAFGECELVQWGRV